MAKMKRQCAGDGCTKEWTITHEDDVRKYCSSKCRPVTSPHYQDPKPSYPPTKD